MTSPTPSAVAPLDALRRQLRILLTSSLGSEAEAERFLQCTLVKALQRAVDSRDEVRRITWFSRLFRHALADQLALRDYAQHGIFRGTATSPIDVAQEQLLARCVILLGAGLDHPQGALLQAVEIDGRPLAAAAADLNLSSTDAIISLRHARAALRARLEAFFGTSPDGRIARRGSSRAA